MSHTLTVFYGAIINPESLTKYDALRRALIIVNPGGTITTMVRDVDPLNVQTIIGQKVSEIQAVCGVKPTVELTMLKDGEFLMPGFVDTHTHAPQVPNIGSGGQYELLDWLKHITYPMEANFKNAEFAEKIYPNVVRRFIDFGTTTCCYYGSSHLESTIVLAQVVEELGQRAFVGKCNMNRNCPDDVREPSVAQAIDETIEMIKSIRRLKSDLVQPILSPRFAIASDGDLLRELGNIAKLDETIAIQTHISENKKEVKETLDLFPGRKSYADVYDHYGLLTERTILGHGVYFDKNDLEIIKKRNAGVSHCPTSNFNLSSGMAKVAEILDHGIKVGLGTDVSGGYSPSILTTIRDASKCSKMVALQTQLDAKRHKHARFVGKPLRIETLLYLATLGGASLCCMNDKIGSFALGKSFDALVVSVRPETGNLAVWSMPGEFSETKDYMQQKATNELKARLERFLFGGDDENILKVFVQGKCIGGMDSRLHLEDDMEP